MNIKNRPETVLFSKNKRNAIVIHKIIIIQHYYKTQAIHCGVIITSAKYYNILLRVQNYVITSRVLL